MADYSVYRDPKTGEWISKRDDADRAAARSGTQGRAEYLAKQLAGNSGGGEVTIHGRDGKIRDRDTVAPGNDPRQIRDTRH
jgi:hypothetical protein